MDVAIIGGGPAGCAAAYALKLHTDCNITIYEPEKLGGCSHTQHYDNIPFEFGPQVMFTDCDRLRKIFEQFLTQTPPPSEDGEYHYLASLDGTLENMHDFPVTCQNILRLPEPEKVIHELYQVNLNNPDYTNFEKYCISRVGRTLYELYIKNYNRKQWKIEPHEMDTEWVKYRPLTLQPTNTRFNGQWQGHPGDYNPMWRGMTDACRLQKGYVTFDKKLNAYVEDERIQADLIVSTISLSEELEFINTCKIYVVLKDSGFVMPAPFNTFPNNYSFVRVFEYKQQYFVESEFALLDFAFPWKGECEVDNYIAEVRWFCQHVLKREIVDCWVANRRKTYPLNTKENTQRFWHMIEEAAQTNVVATGRAGLHAYCSKDTCLRMGLQIAENLEDVLAGGNRRQKVQRLMRSNLH